MTVVVKLRMACRAGFFTIAQKPLKTQDDYKHTKKATVAGQRLSA